MPKRSGGAGKGGSGTGMGGKKLEYVQPMPKFLQEHAHLLAGVRGGGGVRSKPTQRDPSPEPSSSTSCEEKNREEEGLSAGVSTDALKAKGNAFFSKGKFEEAVDAFSDCIAVDPASAVFYSNRSAAHAKLGKYDKALSDAKCAVRLKPEWAKAHSRLGYALFALGDFDPAIESFQRTLELDPSDKQARSSIEKAAKQRGKHVFKRKPTAGEKDAKRRRAEEPSKGKNSNKVKLSFADEDEDEGE
mmetsp:Transcript_13857/g.34920  ORF Transcript_13857/g.34920 Transcript_13857/m.34920 type:complete len:245 (+) Transcript_13857:118-852(+)